MTFPRGYNFSAGPSTLPLPVLEALSDSLFSYGDYGAAAFEVSHRSARFEALNQATQERLLKLIGLFDTHECLFLHTGASGCFSFLPLNFLGNAEKTGPRALYLITGHWSQKAADEAQRLYAHQVDIQPFEQRSEALSKKTHLFLHHCDNETLSGRRVTLSENDLSRTFLDVTSSILLEDPSKHTAIAYGSTQKQLGVAGMTVLLVRKDFMRHHNPSAHLPLNYNLKHQLEQHSLAATPPSLNIFVLSLMLDYFESQGLPKLREQLRARAQRLYDLIDRSAFYSPVDPLMPKAERSVLNVSFKTPSEELDTKFWQDARKEGLLELKGHRALGGIRASLYFGLPDRAVESLCDFMTRFENTHG